MAGPQEPVTTEAGPAPAVGVTAGWAGVGGATVSSLGRRGPWSSAAEGTPAADQCWPSQNASNPMYSNVDPSQTTTPFTAVAAAVGAGPRGAR